MQKIATLGPSVRLIVFQFHVKNASVPEGIPKYSDFHKSTASQFQGTGGIQVMEPTADVLSDFVADSGYCLIDAWYATEEEDWNRSVVRFVFCRKEYENRRLRPDFVDQRDSLLESFNGLTGKNLWKTMAHINPFFVEGKMTDESVLMLDCNSRKQTVKLVPTSSVLIDNMEFPTDFVEQPVMVFQSGREKPRPGEFIGQGIGPKILLTDKANHLKLIGNEIVLAPPALTPESVSAPVA